MAQELIVNVTVNGEENIPKITTNLDKTTKASNKTTNAFTAMRKEVRDAKADMLTFTEGSKEYNAALDRAASAADRMRDMTDKVKVSQRDFGVVSKNVAGAVSGLAGGFAAAQGVISLFGVENEDTAKAILKVQAALSVATGIAQFGDSLDSIRDLLGAFKSSTKEVVDNVSEISNVTKTAAGDVSNLSKEAAVMGSNMAGSASLIEGNKEAISGLNKSIKELDPKRVSEMANAMSEAFGMDIEEAEQAATYALKDQDEALKDVNETTKTNANVTDVATKSTASFGKTVLVTLGSMVLFTAAIAGVIVGISALIKWMNQIPEDVKIKIGLEEEAVNKIQDIRIKITKWQSDYDKARESGNKTQLTYLEEIAKKEFGLSDKKLQSIKNNKTEQKKYFDWYQLFIKSSITIQYPIIVI